MERKKFLAVVMAVLMALTLLPSMVFAAALPSGELGGKLKIKGLAAVGTVLSADYSKVTPEGVTDADVTFSWSRQTGEKELTQVGTEKNYTVTQDDLGYKLVLDIAAVEGGSLTGKLTAKTAEVAATEEEAKAAAQQNPEEDETAESESQDAADDTESMQQDAQEDESQDTTGTENDQNTESQTAEEDQTVENQDSEVLPEENQSTDSESEETELPAEETAQSEEASQVQEAQQAGNEAQDSETADQESGNEEATESTNDSLLHIYTESELQADGTEKTTNNEGPDKENTETSGENPSEKAAYEAQASLDGDAESCDFGTIETGSEGDVQAQFVQITNTGSETLNFQSVSPEHFMVADIEEPLAAGESVSVWVQPREGLEAGDYDDTITYQTEEGAEVSFEAKVTVEDEELFPADDPSEEPADGTDNSDTPVSDETTDNTDGTLASESLSVDTNDLSFSDLKENYEQVDETQTVTVTNTGDTTISLKVPQSDYFDILTEDGSSAESGTQLEKGASATFQIQPKNGLPKGEYSEVLIFGSEETNAQITASVSVKAAEEESVISVEADPATVNYDNLKEGYDTPEATTVTLANTGNTTVTLVQPEAQYFDIGTLSATELAAGETVSFTATPTAGLGAGSYSESIQIMQTDSDGQTSVVTEVKVSVTVAEAKKVYKLSVNPEELDFGKAEAGYAEAPAAQKVTVTNTGNATITLSAPESTSFKTGKLSATELAPGESSTFKIRPKEGMKEGSYLESVVIPNEQQISAMVNVKFTVKAQTVKLTGIQTPSGIKGVKNGTEKSAKALGLPSVVVINTTKGDMKANVQWNVKESSYDPSEKTEQSFKVKGTVVLPDGVTNPDEISLITAVKVTVKAGRTAKIADPADNKITGIQSEGYTTQSKITFAAVGAGMDNESPGADDVRYVPDSWKVINTNSWSEAPYTATFGITKAGTYNLTVIFNRQKYNGSKWENTGEQDTKQVSFSISQAQTVTATPTPQPNGTNQKNAVRTGDTTNIVPFVIILVIAAVCIVGVVVYKKKKK